MTETTTFVVVVVSFNLTQEHCVVGKGSRGMQGGGGGGVQGPGGLHALSCALLPCQRRVAKVANLNHRDPGDSESRIDVVPLEASRCHRLAALAEARATAANL